MWMPGLSVFETNIIDITRLNETFGNRCVQEPGAGQKTAIGFAPTPEGIFLEVIGPLSCFQVGQTERHLPADAIERKVRDRLGREATERDGETFASVTAEMLAIAPVREKLVPVVYDSERGRLYVFATGKLVDDVAIPLLREATPELSLRYLRFEQKAEQKLMDWLRDGAPPSPFRFGNAVTFCVDGASEEEGAGKAKAAFKGVTIPSEACSPHIASGDQVLHLQMIWQGTIAFDLSDRGSVKRIGPPGCKMKAKHAISIWPDIMDSLPNFFADVGALLGGVQTGDIGTDRVECEDDEDDTEDASNDVGWDQQGSTADGPVGRELAHSSQSSMSNASTGAGGAAASMTAGAAGGCPVDQKVVISVLVLGDPGRAGEVVGALDRTARFRDIDQLVVCNLPDQLGRAAYRWAQARGISITLVDAKRPTGEWVPEMAAPGHTGAIVLGQCDNANAYRRHVQAQGVRLFDLDEVHQ